MKTRLLAFLSVMVFCSVYASVSPQVVRDLNAAVQGEYNTNHRYEAYASMADKEGLKNEARLFRAIARAEKVHRQAMTAAARAMGVETEEPQLEPIPTLPIKEALEAIIKNETKESTVTYPALLEQLKKEKDADIAIRIIGFAKNAEAQHARLFKAALDNLGKNKEVSYSVCPVCSYITEGKPADSCPSCQRNHPPVELE